MYLPKIQVMSLNDYMGMTEIPKFSLKKNLAFELVKLVDKPKF